MSVARAGAILPGRNFIPMQYSTYMQAKYYGDNVVPLISNHDWSGDLNKVGDTVTIRKRPSVQVYDGVIGEDLQQQASLADDTLTLSIDYFNYFNVPISDIDKFESDIDFATQILDEGEKAMSNKVETRVLSSIYSSATSTVTAAALDASNALKFFMQAALKLNLLNVPQDNRWAVIDMYTAYFLGLTELRVANTTGEGAPTSLRTGVAYDKPIAGFKCYASNNLSSTASLSHVICGHMDALCFAGQIKDSETVRNPKQFGDLLRSKIVYGYKVVKPDALVHMDVTSFGSL